MERVTVGYSEDAPILQSGVWRTGTRTVTQPVLYIGLPFCRKVSTGLRLCGSKDAPSKPWFFGNYSDEHFKIASVMLFFDLAPSAIDEFEFVRAGDKVTEPRVEYRAKDFPGLLERVELAHDVLVHAPFKNHLVMNFKKTERWQTIFKATEVNGSAR